MAGITFGFTGSGLLDFEARIKEEEMKITKAPWLVIPILFLCFCSRSEYQPTIRFPYQWLDVQGYGGDIDKQQFREPSGICYHAQRGTLFVVSDEGEIAEIRKDGTPVANWMVKGDLEAIALVPETGLLYIGVEGDDIILEFDPEKGEVTRKFPINREFKGDPNFLQKQVDEYADGWQRERADYANYRRIVERDQQETRQNILSETVKRYLVINDDIERALKKAPDEPQVAPWVDGIRLIYQKLQGILDAEGVKRIPAEEEHFDPNRHEAIMTEENSEVESGRIIEIIEQGYTIGDRVIRPARVKIAK